MRSPGTTAPTLSRWENLGRHVNRQLPQRSAVSFPHRPAGGGGDAEGVCAGAPARDKKMFPIRSAECQCLRITQMSLFACKVDSGDGSWRMLFLFSLCHFCARYFLLRDGGSCDGNSSKQRCEYVLIMYYLIRCREPWEKICISFGDF